MASDDESRLASAARAVLAGAGQGADDDAIAAAVAQLLAYERLDAAISHPEGREDRLAIFEVFVPHVARGATSWLEIFAAMDDEDRARVDAVLRGRKLSAVLAWHEQDYELPEAP